jgi:hypothetical protein
MPPQTTRSGQASLLPSNELAAQKLAVGEGGGETWQEAEEGEVTGWQWLLTDVGCAALDDNR